MVQKRGVRERKMRRASEYNIHPVWKKLWVITVALRSVATAYYIMNNFNQASLVLWEAGISCSSCWLQVMEWHDVF